MYSKQFPTNVFGLFLYRFLKIVLNFVPTQNIFKYWGISPILSTRHLPYKTSKSMQLWQQCSKSLSLFFIIHLKTFQTFMSLQNILFVEGTGGILLLKVEIASALKSGPVPVLGSSGLGPWTGPDLIFPNMEGPWTGLHKTGFTRSWAVLGPVLVKTDS